ncbi:response regulator transcription factor [Nocardioides mangrovi]|uniref:Response regulator transcription factor n=1 Tax=Nocardioides mangrovi TaxID=2874580 RepID=A0ABS7UHI3_9ACTN|nr:response regulator transcription factor [Nocardioides mangrovi]MBZ5740470.1 response regulator transcription factor [Nocardioides mangrovi]
MTSQPVSVGVYSHQEIVREGIMSLLSRHPDKVAVVPTPTHPGDPDPDVVLYDVMALLDGDTGPLGYLVDMTASKVLAVGHDLRPDLVGTALTTGVDGFFSIGADEKELLAAVESAATGWRAGDPGENPTVGSSASAARANQLGGDLGLSEREVQVIALIARGRSNQQIAAELFVSINSVKSYIRTAYRKIGVQSRGAAVGWAIRHGFGSTD